MTTPEEPNSADATMNETTTDTESEELTGLNDAKTDEHEHENEDEPLTDAITRALTLKEEGNAHFKSGEYNRAVRSYRRGASALKNHDTTEDQVKALLLSLQTNLSLVCLKQGKAAMSRDVATKALELDEKHVKALYRRGVAHRSLGDYAAANKDLRAAYRIDPDNREVKRELVALKK